VTTSVTGGFVHYSQGSAKDRTGSISSGQREQHSSITEHVPLRCCRSLGRNELEGTSRIKLLYISLTCRLHYVLIYIYIYIYIRAPCRNTAECRERPLFTCCWRGLRPLVSTLCPLHLVSSSPRVHFTSCPLHLVSSSPRVHFTSCPLHLVSTSPRVHFTLCPLHLVSTSPRVLFTSCPLHLVSSSPCVHFTS